MRVYCLFSFHHFLFLLITIGEMCCDSLVSSQVCPSAHSSQDSTILTHLFISDQKTQPSWSALLVEVFQALHHQQVSDLMYMKGGRNFELPILVWCPIQEIAMEKSIVLPVFLEFWLMPPNLLSVGTTLFKCAVVSEFSDLNILLLHGDISTLPKPSTSTCFLFHKCVREEKEPCYPPFGYFSWHLWCSFFFMIPCFDKCVL